MPAPFNQPQGYAGAQGQQGQHPTVPYGQEMGQFGQQVQGPQFMPARQDLSGMAMQFGPGENYGQARPIQQPQGQQYPHPTVPFGQAPQQPGQMPGFIQGQGAPQYPQQPQGFQGMAPPQQQFVPPVAGRPSLDDGMILDGPNVPQELRGRTWGQVKQVYSTLANHYLQGQRTPAPVGGGAATPQGGPNGNTGAPANGQGAPRRWDWSNPEESIGRVVEERVGALVAPVLQSNAQQGMAAALQQARGAARDFDALYPEVMQKLQGFTPDQLTDPSVWINAARLVRGEQVEQGRYRPNVNPNQGGDPRFQPGQQQNAVSQFGASQNGQPTYQPWNGEMPFGMPSGPRAVPAQPYQYFTESATPPSMGGGGSLSPQQMFVARQMGMTPEQYMMWSGGVR